MEHNNLNNIISHHNGGVCLDRPRLNMLLERALHYPLAVVCAGSGYGKTRAASAFLSGYNAEVTWTQVSERDNIAARFWESYVSMLALSWPEIKPRLIDLGFPGTDESFTRYTVIMQEIGKSPGKRIRVFDDFHLLHDKAVLSFFERAVNVIPANVTMLLITRTMPEINTVGMILRERIYTINEDDLCFTEDEIAAYFRQLSLNITKLNTHIIYEDTQGWAFAVNLIGRALCKDQRYERCALEAMKTNIFRLIEAEISKNVSAKLWSFLLRLSLIDHLAASLIRELANDEGLIRELESLNAYIRYDSSLDAWMIHHLFLDYLRQNQHMLTDAEKRDTCNVAGAWCDANGYHMDAFAYYEKSGNYDAIARKVCSFNVQIPPEMAGYILELFDNAPESARFQNPLFPGMHIRARATNGKLGEDTVRLAEKYADEYEALPDSPDKFRALTGIYSGWALLRMLKSTYDDVYDFDIPYRKMDENYRKNPFKTLGSFNIVPISAWASLVGSQRAGAQEEYIAALSRSIPSTSSLGKGFFIGFDDLALGELHFYRGLFDSAEQYLKQSVAKAQACDQYVTMSRALAYLTRIAFFKGNFKSATAKLQALEPLLSDKDQGVRYTIYDIVCGYYYIALGQTDQVPEWLKEDFSPYAHPSFMENYANRIKAQYQYQTRRYNSLLAFIGNETGHTVLYGKIEFKLLESLSLYKLKRRREAIVALEEAYKLAEPNRLTIIFSQYSKDMRTLTAAALKDGSCKIPPEWLEDVNRKSAAYAKRQSHMIAEYMAAYNIEKGISLTGREINILTDLSHGLSRTEIAASQNLSVNTVKMVINNIYDKLHVICLPDAIRVAVDRKIV